MPRRRRVAWSGLLTALLVLLDWGAAWADEVALRVVQNHPFIEIAINGHPTVALLDTGAAVSWIDEDLAAELGIGALWLLADEGSGPYVRNDRTVPAAVYIGGHASQERTLGLIDVDAIFENLPDGAPRPRAIIGLDVLSDYVIELDFDRSAASFTPAGEYSDFPSQPSMALEREAGLAVLNVKLDGRNARTVIDTGATSAVHLSSSFEGAEEVIERAASQTLVGTVSGVRQRPIASLGAVDFLGWRFRSVPATVAAQPIGGQIDAVAGMQLLGQFNLILDLSRSRMWTKPNNNFGKPFRRDRVGLQTLADPSEGGAPLVLVAPGSPAERAGFRTGEIVQGMRDEAGARIESGRDVAPGQKVTVLMGDGSSRTLVGAEYY